MPSSKVIVCFIFFVGFISQIHGLVSMRYDVPANFTKHTLSLCSCNLGESCNTTVIVPMMESSASREWVPVSSSSFQSSATQALQCEEQQLRLTISEGSFALLATGELLHVHSKLVISNSSFCLKKSYSEDYVMEENQRIQQVMLEAEICLIPPKMNLCCPSGSSISKIPPLNTDSNSTLSCVPSEAPSFDGMQVSFDGSSHKWALEGQVRDFPTCQENLSTVPLNAHQSGFGYLQLVEDQLQFRWQPAATEKYISVDSSKYCIGQEQVYNAMKPVVALCHSEHIPEDNCQTTACFGKCCPEEQIYDLELNKCVTSSFIFSWSPFREADDGYRVVSGMPSCESFFAISAVDPTDPFQLLANGSLLIESWSRAVTVPEYCFDIFQNQTHSVAMALVCFGDDWSKPHDNLEDQSTVLYVLSSVLLISAAHLIVSLASYLCTVKRENLQNTNSRNMETLTCVKINIFQSLMCVFVCFSALQILLVSTLQFAHQNWSQPFCNIVAVVAEGAALASSGFIVALWLQMSCSLHSLGVWQRGLLFSVPVVPAILVPIITFFIAPVASEACDINAAFADPWATWPITLSNALLLLVAFAGLSIPLCMRKYALTIKGAVTKPPRLCCLGTDSEKDIDEKSAADESLEENTSGNYIVSELRLENNRWWLLLKLDCLLLVTVLSSLLVWQPDAVAFWAFGDILLTFKSNVMASCLWIYICKHCKRI